MPAEQNRRIAERLLEAIGSGAPPGEISSFFAEAAVIEIPGDVGALPWIGRNVGKAAIEAFVSGTGSRLERQRFEILDIATSELRAVILGELTSRVVSTGRIIDQAFAIVLTIAGGKIEHFQMIEDSFAVSRAARR